jgi:hypothetical protein
MRAAAEAIMMKLALYRQVSATIKLMILIIIRLINDWIVAKT